MTTTFENRPVQDSPGVTIMPPIVLYTSLTAGIVLELAVPTRIPMPLILRLILGTVVTVSAFWFMMAGHNLFGRMGTNVPTNKPSTVLVTGGAYRYSRNPMYVGMTGTLLGVGLLVGGWWLVAASIPLAAYLALFVVPREEAYMTRTYGEQYLTYKNRVRRWL